MRHQHALRDLLHGATHRVPGVPAHAERSTGHQGRARRHHRSHRHGVNHSAARPPRVLAAWQARIARLFGQDPG
ncbi:MAG TPA: hypothetical protein VE172_13655 [Stackebrandtia sp.]|jgi:hypothetical protein|uniref:hypothetical protein n=1 Tax=Stackebrandtia sp. TaxID=2023065 RepID=UPI002D2FB2BB|nr:hypothetical protein [Stackebrandtia sp.]HZE39848.1 hypothetical protein [Stackebrandtia sp.]